MSARWLSENPAKAEVERFFLLYSPIWMIAMAAVVLTGAWRTFDDVAYMIFGLALGAPPVLVPWVLGRLRPGRFESDRPLFQRHWLRANLWLWVLVFIGSYVITEYFFDVMGMRYGFPATWTLDANIVGSGAGVVPIFLYPVTQAYFITYHVGMTVALRRLRTGWALGPVGVAIAVVVLSYAVAFGETWFMASDLLSDVFRYPDRTRMLAIGSLFYATIFVFSLPLYARLDEPGRSGLPTGAAARGGDEPLAPPHDPRPWWMLAVEAAGAGMAAMLVMDAWSWLFGRLA
jgi:cycloeucalenol cycloisomerase